MEEIKKVRPQFEPPKKVTGTAPDYQGPIRDYPDKEMWYEDKMFGGMLNAATIYKSNGGGDSYPIDRFINSLQGEKMLEGMKYEFAIYGNHNWADPEYVKLWNEQGITMEDHNAADPKHEILFFAPADRKQEEKLPVIIDYHGGGGTLFESINHGFVRNVKKNNYIVICPEEEGTDTKYAADHLPALLDLAEELGYPIDRKRVYLVGHSMGCVASVYGSLSHPGLVAAIAVHSGSGVFGTKMPFLPLTDEMYAKSGPIPMYLEMGEFDMGNLPLEETVIQGLNKWIAMNGCRTKAAATESNMVGVSGDDVYTENMCELDYTFVDFKDESGDVKVKLGGVEMLAHWVSYDFPDLAWDFLKKYAK